jgi:hypothetical protein
MKWTIGVAIAALLMGGCAVYADPYPYYPAPRPPGVYVTPLPLIVTPVYPWWGWHAGWHGGGHRR